MHFFKNHKNPYISLKDDPKLKIPKDLNSTCKTDINWYLDRHTTPHRHMVKNAWEGMGKSVISGFTDEITRLSQSNPQKAPSGPICELTKKTGWKNTNPKGRYASSRETDRQTEVSLTGPVSIVFHLALFDFSYIFSLN